MSESYNTRFELLMDAGNGAQKAGDILVTSLAKAGQYVFIEPIIPAEISPPKRTPHSMSGVVIRLSNQEITNIGDYSELMLVEHEILLERRLMDKEYAEKSLVLIDMGDEQRAPEAYESVMALARSKGLQVCPFRMDEEVQGIMKTLNGNGKNMFYLGMLTAFYHADKEDVEKAVRQTFKKLPLEKLEKNLIIFKKGHDLIKELPVSPVVISSQKRIGEHVLLDGNTALALGMIDAGIRFFSGYPITPASSIMHTLAKIFPSYGGILHQAEDEISAIGASIGAYYGGTPAVTATSGPGLSLKQEFIGFASVAEIPIIIVDVQRGGPSTGLPTRTEQSDLLSAIFGTHGDSTKIVLSVSDVEDCFYAPHLARYLTETCKVPVFIMSDYMTSVSYKIFEKLKTEQLKEVSDISDRILDRFFLKKLKEVKMVKAQQSLPGELGLMRRLTGLNTDENGSVMYTSASAVRSHEVRNEKLHELRRSLLSPELFGPLNAEVLVVGWGSSRGVLKESIELAQKKGISAAGMHLKMVYPLPLSLKEIFSKFKKVMTIEVAYGDGLKPAPLASLLRLETLVEVESGITLPNGRPIKPVQVIEKLMALKGGMA